MSDGARRARDPHSETLSVYAYRPAASDGILWVIRRKIEEMAELVELEDGAEAETAASADRKVGGVVALEDHLSDRHFAMNLARGLQVLRAFSAETEILSNREIAQLTGLPKATVSRLTYTLILLGYLRHDHKQQKFRLGPGVISLGYPLFANLRARKIAQPLLDTLARKTGCTANLGMRDRLCVIHIDTCSHDPSNSLRPDIGTSRPLLSTAIGRALVLASGKREQSAILNQLRLEDPERFERDLPAYAKDEVRLRDLGYCLSRGNWRPEMHAVAVPVTTLSETLAINCTMHVDAVRGDFLEREVAPRLIETGREIERQCALS